MKLTAPQRRALTALDVRILRQAEDVYRTGRVRRATLERLCSDGLARSIDLKPATWLRTPYHRFFVRTPAGDAALARGAG